MPKPPNNPGKGRGLGKPRNAMTIQQPLWLVELVDAYEHLRIDYTMNGSPDDAWLNLWIPAISQAVALWLKEEWRLYVPEKDSLGEIEYDSNGEPYPELDSAGQPIVAYAVRAAVLIELASQYRYREGEGRDNVVPESAGHGYTLSKGATALLSPLRQPTAV